MTPTQSSESEFKTALHQVISLSGSGQPGSALSPSLVGLLQGLGYMAVALRALYIKVEEVETLVKRQQGLRH